ncbi:MAG: hypothetical protein ACHQ1F_04560 [Spirochaetia bacterium]
MARIAKSISGLLFVLFLASCATTTVSVEKNKNPAFDELLTRLFVEVDAGDWKCSYNAGSSDSPVWKEIALADYLTAAIEKKFQENGVDTKAIRLNQVDVDQVQIMKEINEFGAAVMEVHLTEAVVTPDRYVLHGIFDVSVHDISDKSAYWRAKITADGGKSYIFYPVAIDQSKVVDSIVSGLQKDGLIAAH